MMDNAKGVAHIPTATTTTDDRNSKSTQNHPLVCLKTLLIYAALTTGISNAPLVALVILAVAALAGFYLASIHLRGQVAKKPIVFLHAGVAVIGFLALFGAVLGMF